MKSKIPTIIGAVFTMFTVACRMDTIYQQDQLITVDHPAYTAQLIKPEKANFSDRNVRFVEGGWLLNLIPKDTQQNIFFDRTTIPGHNAYGLPVEFLDVTPLKDNLYLRPGVGIVSRESPGNHFHDQIHERFPWYSEVKKDKSGTTVYFYQLAPHFYFYTRTVRFENNSKQITLTDKMQNLGNKTIESTIFFHPFFRISEKSTPWCRLDDKPDFKNPKRPPLPGYSNAFFKVEENHGKKTWFVCGDSEPRVALGVEHAETVGFWGEKKPDSHVFAVEPFVKLSVPPWQTKEWSWHVVIP